MPQLLCILISQVKFYPFLTNHIRGNNEENFNFQFYCTITNRNVLHFRRRAGKQFADFAETHRSRFGQIGYLWLNPQADENVPQLATLMRFRGTNENDKMQAFLFYNGKQISKKEAFGGNYIKQKMSSPIDDPLYRWQMWRFVFDDVRGFNKSQSANDYSSQFFLDKNPGEYEIKVMRENQLARSMKFTVGKIADNGVKDKNRIGVRMIFPVSVIGTADGKWNAAAWKTGALYANPLVGFTAIQ